VEGWVELYGAFSRVGFGVSRELIIIACSSMERDMDSDRS
jgi:hypothetical protein